MRTSYNGLPLFASIDQPLSVSRIVVPMATVKRTEFGERLWSARKHAGLTQKQVEKLTGIPQSTSSTAERAGDSSTDTAVYAKLYCVNAHWLATGEGDMLDSNVTPGPQGHGPYPLISYIQAGEWTEKCENFDREDAAQWLVSTKNLGRYGYFLRVRGKSMENPGGEYDFREGMILHINADMLDPSPGQFVIVRREGTNESTFKKYTMIEGEPYLEAINPNWPLDKKFLKLQPGDVWCGVVVDASLGKMP